MLCDEGKQHQYSDVWDMDNITKKVKIDYKQQSDPFPELCKPDGPEQLSVLPDLPIGFDNYQDDKDLLKGLTADF